MYSYSSLINYRQAEEMYLCGILDAFSSEITSVSNMSNYALTNWDQLERERTVIVLGSIKDSLKKAEMSISLSSPHFNINSGNTHINVSFISDLFRIYGKEVSELQHAILVDLDDSTFIKEKNSIRNKVEHLSHDFRILSKMDQNQLYSGSYKELRTYWNKVIDTLKYTEVIENYKMENE